MKTKLPKNVRKFEAGDIVVTWINEETSGFQVNIEKLGESIKTWNFNRNAVGEVFSIYWFSYLSRAILQQGRMGLSSIPGDVLELSSEETNQILSAIILH